jgi:asparagine synthase (glutamine-hydrolysing)
LFRFGCPIDDRTLFKGIRTVLPGISIAFDGETLEKVPAVPISPEVLEGGPTEERILGLHSAALRPLVEGDFTYGAFLSGGLDTSFNVYQLARLSAKPVNTFTVGFADTAFDESHYAGLVAKRFHTKHRVLKLESNDCLRLLPDMVRGLEEPIIDYSFIPSFLAAKFAAEYVDVVVGGDGPDHLLSRWYASEEWYRMLEKIPLASAAARWAVEFPEKQNGIRRSLWKKLRRSHRGRRLWIALASGVVRPAGWGLLNVFASSLWGQYGREDVNNLFSSGFVERFMKSAKPPKPTLVDYDSDLPLDVKFCIADTTYSGRFGVFAKAGRMCKANGLILHEPYLWPPLMKAFLFCDSRRKYQGKLMSRLTRSIPSKNTKLALRKIAAGRIPNRIAEAKPKQGFEPPLGLWLRERLAGKAAGEVFRVLLSETDWFQENFLETLIREHVSGKRENCYLLILLASLDLWHEIYFSGDEGCSFWMRH